MPKIIELTVEIEIQRVSCPGVWLCQDGRVSLSVYALGTSYNTCLLPPVFPLLFKDIFFFRKRFQETCLLNNITCLLRDETIFCELVQWCEDSNIEESITLAQYLGALNDVLFPPNMCSNDGVDLLMRRSKHFPGILSPKIEIATKVRIDEVLNHTCCVINKAAPCHCTQNDMEMRQKQVCHTPQYHRNKCYSATKRSRSHSRSGSSRSCMSFKEPDIHVSCRCPNPIPCSPRSQRSPTRRPPGVTQARPDYYYTYNANTGDVADDAFAKKSVRRERLDTDDDYTCPRPRSPRHSSPRGSCPRPSPVRSSRSPGNLRQYQVYNTNTGGPANSSFNKGVRRDSAEFDEMRPRESDMTQALSEERMHKTLLESRFIENEINEIMRSKERKKNISMMNRPKLKPCICEICRRYHELFHSEQTRC